MNLQDSIEECCMHIESNRITDRKKYCERLSNLLDNEELVGILNQSNTIGWKYVMSSVQECLRKDAEKIMEEAKKKGTINNKFSSAELFLQILKIATNEADFEINVPKVVGYIIGCLRDQKMKKCYDAIFLRALKDYILSNARCRGKLESEDWTELFTFIQKLYEEKPSDMLLLKCISLIIKWGPNSGLPTPTVKEQFEFITKLCLQVTRNSPTNYQEDVLDTALDFCGHTSKDNRVSCCKLGEDVYSNFVDLYDLNGRAAKIKEQLIEFFLLQVTIHQPNGITEHHPCAYACDWTTWKKCLKLTYSLLSKEIYFYFKYTHKNNSFFILKGDSMKLLNNFSDLFVQVSRQLFSCPDIDVTMSCSLTSENSQKRQKLDINLKTYINNIQETKSWLWIHIVCSIIRSFPKLLEPEDFLNLLQILSNIQIESNNHNVIINVYSCLSVMLDIQHGIITSEYQLEIDKLWKIVGESTLRAFALNQHKEATENILQKLICRRIIDPEAVLQSYTAGVLNFSLQSIRTLETVLQYLNFAKSDDEKKEMLMNCILNSQNIKDYQYLLYPRTAKVLVNLTLKQWPVNNSEIDENNMTVVDKYGDIKDIYFKTMLTKKIITSSETEKPFVDVVFSSDLNTNQILANVLQNFVENCSSEPIEHLLSIIMLLINITNYMIQYKVLSEDKLNNYLTVRLIEKIFNYDIIKSFQLYENKNDREAKKLIECVEILVKIFQYNEDEFLATKIKEIVPFELLRNLVKVLNDLQEDQNENLGIKFELKKAIARTLSSFSCISGIRLNQNQKHIMEVLSAPYNCSLDGDYAVLHTFLSCFKNTKPGIIENKMFNNILKSVEAICVARYQNYDNAVEILTILHDLYPHLAVTNDYELKTTSVALLKPFYDKTENYGPKVSLCLLDCVIQLCQVDPENKFSFWEDTEIIKYVPNLMCSDYQEVRFKTIETLVKFFQVMSKSKRLENFHKQEEIFAKIYEMSIKVFEVTGEITQERRIDEIITRTASVLHTYTSIILFCNTWIKESLFALVKLVHKKELKSVDKVLEMINQHFHGEAGGNCIEKYLKYILEKWLSEGYSINNFRFELFHCENKLEFYLKYFEICVVLLMGTDKDDLVAAGNQLQLSEKNIVELTCSRVFGNALCNDIENMAEVVKGNKTLKYYSQIVGLDGLKNCLIDNIDQLLLCILNFLTDEIYIHECFDETVIFSSKSLSVGQLKSCLNFVESFLCEGSNTATFLSENNPSKLEKILLSLKMNMYNIFTTDDGLISFHRYAFFINTILENISSSSTSEFYFIRDTIYTLINFIDNNKSSSVITLGICRFLGSFLTKILPKFAETFEKCFVYTVNSLKNFALQINTLTDICVEILRFLIIQNSRLLKSSIQKLDNFPQQQKFNEIRKVHMELKYGNKQTSLEDEINYFLQHEDLSTRQDSLVHLRKVFSKEKIQLKQLYDKLQDIRGFSEDCEKSLLHRLICLLAKLSCSTNEDVSFEAVKCLGELGPANLMTLVLQPEKEVLDLKCSPLEFLMGQLVALLSRYLTHHNIKIVKTASEALYIVLDCKEGKKIADSGINFGHGVIDKQWLHPFFQNKSVSASNVGIDAQAFAAKINNEKLWCPDDHSCHKKWIVLLVSTLLETFTYKSFLSKLVPICKVKPKLCEHLLPLLINILLHINNKLVISILSNMIDGFFSNHWNLTVPKYKGENLVTVNKKSVKCMLNVVGFVRLQKSFVKTKSRHVGVLDLNYLKVAKAAEFCAAHFTALLYSELWCQTRIEEIEKGRRNFEFMIGYTTLDIIYENENEEVGEALQNITRNAYKAIGDLDALPGCGTSFILKPQFRVEHYKELGKWEQVTHFYEMQVSHGDDSARKDLMESLKNCSLYYLPLLCTKQSDEAQYECLWRLGQWNVEKRNLSESTNLNPVDYDKYRFYALKGLHDNSSHSFIEAKKSQTLCVIENLKHISLENSQNIYPILTQLQALVEMEDFAEAMELKNFVSLVNKWKLQDALVRRNDFQYIEPIIAQRIVMVSDYLKVQNEETMKSYMTGLLLDFAELAREEGHFQVATTAMSNVQTISDLSEDIKTQIQLMDAKLSWSVNNKLVARHILNKLCKNEDINPKLRYTALKLSGQYMSETYSENRLTIISDYFLKSLAVIKELDRTSEDKKSIVDTYDKLAQFADKGYQQIMTYMKSDLFQRKIVNMEKAKETASNIRKQRSKTEDECKAAAIQHKQSNIDEIEIKNTKQERNHYLRLALKYYLMNLTHTDDNNIKIFRIMSICLENRNNPIIADTLKENLPSYKYITMLPQLIPHITENGADLYSQKVNQIVERCAIDHPHHTLPLLLFLANSNKDQQFNNPKTNTSSNDARMSTAKNMINKLKKREDMCEVINKLQQLSEALIELAYYNDKAIATEEEKKNGIQISRSQKITKIRNLEVLLPTHTLPVSKTSNYSNIVTVCSFGSIYHPVGGINTPKRITCRGSDGKVRSQLVKGHDDIRQDAVMQQVFTIMNNLLSNNKQTRNLLIRTYKIVPLSMRSGILEWVDNTIPIGKYLVGEDRELGAHHIYRPQDRSPESCKKIYRASADRTAEEKLQTFKTICKDLKPVFHKFFESSFPHPTIWYERKRAYIHSVATTSMCGYILGIGDRHVSNILIDKTTAEVIHIDFGIAFEQGRVLPTPETVPFRLSRDIVDGMGVSGVEGIFRRSCEKTIEVLRQNSQTIITILEVLLYDPLYVWTVTAAEANKRQTEEENDLRSLSSDSDEDNTSVNITAERALLRLREKLQGTELGNPTSIEHQVGTLIQQAMDPANLCKLFCGWQPYL